MIVLWEQVCESHETHIKGPGGTRNSAAPRAEPSLEHLNGKAEDKITSRKALTQRLDRLRLLSILRLSPICVGTEARIELDRAVAEFAALSVASLLMSKALARNMSAGGGDMGTLVLDELVVDPTTVYSLGSEIDLVLVPCLPQLLATYMAAWVSSVVADASAADGGLPDPDAPAPPEKCASSCTFSSSVAAMPPLNPSTFQSTADFTAATWRLAFPESKANDVALSQEERTRLDSDVWPVLIAALDEAGVNASQFVSWLNAKLPVPTTVLPFAAVCVERHRLIQQLKAEVRQGKWLNLAEPHVLERLSARLPARISLLLAHGTATQPELRGAPQAAATTRHRFAGAIYRELGALHAMDEELLLAPQRALGVLVQAGINNQEIGTILTGYQLAPNHQQSKNWMDATLHASYQARCHRLGSWWGATARFDNADKGNRLHVMVCIMTHDREPPPSFPWGAGANTSTLAEYYPCLRGPLPSAEVSRRTHAVPDSELTCALVFGTLSPLEDSALHAARSKRVELARGLDLTAVLPHSLRDGKSGFEAQCAFTQRLVGHSVQPLGVHGEMEALGTIPASPQRRPRRETATMDWTPTNASNIECTAACCDFDPPPRLHRGLPVKAGTMLRVFQDHGDLCSVRVEEPGDERKGNVTADVLGRRPMMTSEERADLVDRLQVSNDEAPPSRWDRVDSIFAAASSGTPSLDHNRAPKKGSRGGKAVGKAAEPVKSTAQMMDEAGDEDDEFDEDFVDGPSSSGDRKRKRSRSLPIDPKTFDGKWPDDLLHCPLTLESAATAIGTRTLQQKMRLMREDAIADAQRHDEEAACPPIYQFHSTSYAPSAPPPPPQLKRRRLNWSADQQEHNHAHSDRELKRRDLVSQRQQKQRHLAELQPRLAANPTLAADVSSLEARLLAIESELAKVTAEQFRLGVSHGSAILDRTVFQVVPFLADWLVTAVPGLQPILTAIVEVKSGYWLVTHLVLEHMLVAWASFRRDLSSHMLAMPHAVLWDWVMRTVVEPAVHLHQAGRGRDDKGRLSHEEAWPLFIVGLKTGLRTLLLSGRHPLYVDCFGRELRELHQLSEEEFARWAFNIWVTIGGTRFTNDECVEDFAVKTLKEALGASFSEEAATRKQARIEAIDAVRRGAREQTDGEYAEAQRQERNRERQLQGQPAIAAALYRELKNRLLPVIHSEAQQAKAAATVGRLIAASCTSRHDGTVAFRVVPCRPAPPTLPASPTPPVVTNVFTEPPSRLVNTDTATLDKTVDERIDRYGTRRFLHPSLGYPGDSSTALQKLSREAPVVIGPEPKGKARLGARVQKERQQYKAALGKAGAWFGSWDIAVPETHPFSDIAFWQLATNQAKASAWATLRELAGESFQPWKLGTGGSLDLPILNGLRRNVLVGGHDGKEVPLSAVGVDALSDMRRLSDDLPRDGEHTGARAWERALRSKVTPLFSGGFGSVYYLFDAIGDRNPYKWPTAMARLLVKWPKLPAEQRERLRAAGEPVCEAAFPIGPLSPTTRLGESMMDKLFGGREAALAALSDFLTLRSSAQLSFGEHLRRIVPPGNVLHLHGVLQRDPYHTITIDSSGPRLTSTVSTSRSPNTEGEDELLGRGLDHISTGSSFLALIDDIDFRAASLVTLPALMFPDAAATTTLGHLFYSKVDRTSASGMEFFSMNEMIEGIANNVTLAEAIRGGPPPLALTLPAAQRLRCAYVAAAMVLLGGDTTPGIHNVNEELGLKLAVHFASYVCSGSPLVFAAIHEASGTEIYKLDREAVIRLHRIWYIHRRTPDIKKKLEPRFDAAAAAASPQAVYNQYSWAALISATEILVPPVGQAGQPVRSEVNLDTLIGLCEPRLLQWGLSRSPDETALAVPSNLILPIDPSRPVSAYNAKVAVDTSKENRGAKRPRTFGGAAAGGTRTAAATPATLISAADLVAEHGQGLAALDEMESRALTQLLKGQLLARATDKVAEEGTLKRFRVGKPTLLGRLREAVASELRQVGPDDGGGDVALDGDGDGGGGALDGNGDGEGGSDGEDDGHEWVCTLCGEAEPPTQLTLECRRCNRVVPKSSTRYNDAWMHRVCSGGEAERLCVAHAHEKGRGARKRSRREGATAAAAAEDISWVACEGPCQRWFHTACVCVAPSAGDEWLCEECVPGQPDEDQDVLGED